jgi:4-hydroxyproline epimerase
MPERIRYVDSHTGGEPTRLVLEGFPDLNHLPLRERVAALRTEHDRYRRAVVTEPRSSDVAVGAVLMPPVEAGSVASVIYFNNAGYLGMCGHGTIGVIATLQHLGRIDAGTHRLDTPVGTVTCTLSGHGEVSIQNVVSYRHRKAVGVDVDGMGRVTGDVAWGGNWFFLVDAHDRDLVLEEVGALTHFSSAVRAALAHAGVTGRDGGEIDHIELFGAPSKPGHDCRNFVLCPGNAYDRSPCGTGTSARLACLAADGALAEGATWRQESIVGSVFEGSYRRAEGGIIPTIKGEAFVCAEGVAILDPRDPFCWGI